MPWTGERPLLLASTSVTRQALLAAAGIPVEAEPPNLDERAFEASLPAGEREPARLALRLARAKAEVVAADHPGRVVVGADQVLDLGGTSISKARDLDEARSILGRMSGRTHRLLSAVSIVRAGEVADEFVDEARLTMRPLGPDAIARYAELAGPAVLRSVGGYQIEGLGIHLFSAVEGEHATVLGLPMLPLLAAFRRFGLLEI